MPLVTPIILLLRPGPFLQPTTALRNSACMILAASYIMGRIPIKTLTRKTPRHVCILINFVRVVTNGSHWLCFYHFSPKEPKEKRKWKEQKNKIENAYNKKIYFTKDTYLFFSTGFYIVCKVFGICTL